MKFEPPVLKNEIYEMNIDDLGTEGQGIGKINGFTVFVENALPNEIIKVLIVKVKKSFAYGKNIEIIKPSKYRVEPFCINAKRCGGCQLQHLSYEGQLEFKRKKVIDCIERIGGFKDIYVNETIGMENPIRYRNKAQFPVGMGKNGIETGFYAKRSHNIINTEKCLLQNEINDEIVKLFKEFMTENNIKPYDEKSHKGVVRHLLTRIGFKTGEIMICVVGNSKKMPCADKLVEKFKNIEGITSIVFNENREKTNVILGNKVTTLYGKDYITDYIGDIKFEISPLSFFQVNPIQTQKLYQKALDLADINENDSVIDIYCGIGTISLFFAKKAKSVLGVEIIPEAIEDAKRNAKINGFTNTRFEVGKAEEVIPALYKNECINADVVVVDPPRKGCDIAVLETISNIKPKKLVYISCDPATMARDLKYLNENGFKIEEVYPVDQFCHTTHCEVITLLKYNNK